MKHELDYPTGKIFVGQRESTREFLRASSGLYYVYVLRRPDTRPFYVGKGKAYRLFNHVNEARHPERSHKLNVIRQIQESRSEIIYEIDSFHDEEHLAHAREVELITLMKRIHEGGCLTNRTAGGEGGSNPSPESREKHRTTLGGIPDDDSDRAVLNRFLLSIAHPKSICIKPEKAFKVRPTQKFPKVTRKPTLRQATALAASAIANGIILQNGCRIPRRLIFNGVTGFIENGVSCDIVTSNMATVYGAQDPRNECFSLDKAQIARLVSLIGEKKLTEAGVL